MEYGSKMRCQRCALPVVDFSDVMMDGTLMFHQHCFKEGIAELNRVYDPAFPPDLVPDFSSPDRE